MRREGNVCNTCQGPLKKNEQAILAANGRSHFSQGILENSCDFELTFRQEISSGSLPLQGL